jgi:hypothetical protein
VTVLRHATVDGDLRVVNRTPFGAADRNAYRLHLPGPQRGGRLQRRHIVALRGGPRTQPELAWRGPLRAGAVQHHHHVAARRHAERHSHGRDGERDSPDRRFFDTLGFSHCRLRMSARR